MENMMDKLIKALNDNPEAVELNRLFKKVMTEHDIKGEDAERMKESNLLMCISVTPTAMSLMADYLWEDLRGRE